MHKHHASAAAQAFHQYTAATHHGSGEALFWLIAAVLVLITIVAVRGNRRRHEYR